MYNVFLLIACLHECCILVYITYNVCPIHGVLEEVKERNVGRSNAINSMEIQRSVHYNSVFKM